MERPGVQRPDVDLGEAIDRERSPEPAASALERASGAEDGTPTRSASRRAAYNASGGGRRVESLHVVDREHERLRPGELRTAARAPPRRPRAGPAGPSSSSRTTTGEPSAAPGRQSSTVEHGSNRSPMPENESADSLWDGAPLQHAKTRFRGPPTPALQSVVFPCRPRLRGRVPRPSREAGDELEGRLRRPGRRWLRASARNIVRPRKAATRARRRSAMRDTRPMGYAIFRQPELDWVPRGEDDPRTVARLSDSMTRSRANLWRTRPARAASATRIMRRRRSSSYSTGRRRSTSESRSRHEVRVAVSSWSRSGPCSSSATPATRSRPLHLRRAARNRAG